MKDKMRDEIRYDEDCELLRNEVRRWLADNFAAADLRAFAASDQASDESLWKATAELGWLGLIIPEEYGGAGLGAVELAVLLEETGRALLPVPVLPSILAGLAISLGGSAEQRTQWLPKIASGEIRASIALVNPDGDWNVARTSVVREGDTLSGTKSRVWDAARTELLVVPFLLDNGAAAVALVEASAAGVETESEVTIDRTRSSGRVRFDGVVVARSQILAVAGEELFASLLPWAFTALAAEAAGGADALLAMTAAYTATRKQFGKPIGSFQAVKHPLVNVLLEVEKTRSLVYGAATAVDAGQLRAESLARMAKAQASDTFVFAASRAVQLHGGYGFTEDCDAHYYLKRARGTRPAFGDAAHHRRWIGTALRAESAGLSKRAATAVED